MPEPNENPWLPTWEPFALPHPDGLSGILTSTEHPSAPSSDQGSRGSDLSQEPCDRRSFSAQAYADTGVMRSKPFDPAFEWTRTALTPGVPLGSLPHWNSSRASLAEGLPTVTRQQAIEELSRCVPVRSSGQDIYDAMHNTYWQGIFETAQHDRDTRVVLTPSLSPGWHHYCLTADDHLYILTQHADTCAKEVDAHGFEQGGAVKKTDGGPAEHHTDAASPYLTDFDTYKATCGKCGEPARGRMLLHISGLAHYHDESLPGSPGVVMCTRQACSGPVSSAATKNALTKLKPQRSRDSMVSVGA